MFSSCIGKVTICFQVVIYKLLHIVSTSCYNVFQVHVSTRSEISVRSVRLSVRSVLEPVRTRKLGSVRTRKREHVDAVKTFNTKKSALSQHVMEFDHRIDWDNVKILKSESHAYRRRVAESFLINQKACSCNVINRNDGANFPTVYSVFVSNK